jgi:two-component system, NarL family, nitrate/nitrite response regulator NarL
MVTILLVDDQPSVRQGLRMQLALEDDLQIIGDVGSGPEALHLAAELQPDVVLMDIEMPGMDGFATTAALRHLVPRSLIVMLTLHDDPINRARAVAVGAHSFVGKHEHHEALLAAVRSAAPRVDSHPPAA